MPGIDAGRSEQSTGDVRNTYANTYADTGANTITIAITNPGTGLLERG
jgi:hypothetical protein